MNTINERIFKVIKHYNYNINSFSKRIGLKNNVTIGNIVGGRKNKPSFDIIIMILLSFDSISCEWLILGEGEMEKKDCFSLASEENSHYIKQSQKCELCEIKDMLIKSQQSEIAHLKEELLRKQKLIR